MIHLFQEILFTSNLPQTAATTTGVTRWLWRAARSAGLRRGASYCKNSSHRQMWSGSNNNEALFLGGIFTGGGQFVCLLCLFTTSIIITCFYRGWTIFLFCVIGMYFIYRSTKSCQYFFRISLWISVIDQISTNLQNPRSRQPFLFWRH